MSDSVSSSVTNGYRIAKLNRLAASAALDKARKSRAGICAIEAAEKHVIATSHSLIKAEELARTLVPDFQP